MPTRNRNSLRMLFPFGLLAVAVLSLIRRKSDAWEYETAAEDAEVRDVPLGFSTARRRGPTARLALVAAFTSLFFAGAAFTAGAGDQLARMLEPDDAAALKAGLDDAAAAAAEAPAATVEAAPAAPEAVPAAPEAVPAAPEAVPAAPEAVAAAPESAPVAVESAPAAEAVPVSDAAVETDAPLRAGPSAVVSTQTTKSVSSTHASPAAAVAPQTRTAKPAPAKSKASATKKWVVKRAAAPAPAPEIEHAHETGFGEPTVWLNRALPDPTPASARLTRAFGHQLVSVSKRHGADWAAVLGVLRAQGERGSVPASAKELDTIAARLANQKAWRGALALSGRTGFADNAEGLADLYRAVGIETLITGYEASKHRLAKRLLAADNVWIYGGGRDDIAAGRIDVRILVVISYLRQRHGSVTISSLFAGHRKFARPGVVSAHVYGHAVDIAAVGEVSIAGHQQPGGITEAAVRSLLLLPAEFQPQQVISLLGLGGPSFPLRDHGDHIHVGF
jgi:hypothetical protein